MGSTESGLYRALELLANFLLLNLLWLLSCLPLVTAYPATAALFGVVREWVNERDPPVLRAFLSFFAQNFKQSLGIGVVWTLLGGVLVGDFAVIGRMSGGLRTSLFAAASLLSLLYLFSSIYLFPIMVNYRTSWVDILRNSLLISVGQMPLTIVSLFVVAVVVALTLWIPITLLLTGSVTAHLVYSLCKRAFERIGGMTEAEPSGEGEDK